MDGRLVRLARRRLKGEAGFSLLEITAAMTILTVGILALAGTAGTAARMLANGRQRQAASQVATQALEHIRNLSYGSVALTSNLTQNADPDHPDADVSADGTQFTYDGTAGGYEDLVVDAGGQVFHTEAFVVGSTNLTAYRYVTWVDDPNITGSQDYKRVIIAVMSDDAVDIDRVNVVRASGYLTDGSVTVAGEEIDPTQGSSSSPSASPSATPSGSCSGDTSGPTGGFTILSGTGASEGFTASTTVTISLAPSDACTPITAEFSNDGSTFSGQVTYDVNNPTATWTVPSGDGVKNVWTRYADGVGNTRTVGPESVTLDETLPTAPGTLTRTLSCSGTNRTATLSWGAASDANLLGYRVYRSIDNGAWELRVTTGSLTATDTHPKTLDSVRFKVAAYDKAGNQGPDSNVISLTKNLCF